MAINCDEIANIVALKILTGNDDIAKELADLSLSKREYRQIINQFEGVKNLDKEIEGLSTHHLKLLESSTEIKIRAIVQASILEGEKGIGAFDELAKQIRLTKSSLGGGISLLEKINKIDIYDIEEIGRLLGNKNTQKAISDLKKNVANFVSANYSISRYSEFKNDFVGQLKKQLEDKEITQRQYDEQIEKAHDIAMENIRTGKWTKSEANQELKKAEQQAKEKILKGKLTPEQAKKELDKAKKEAEKKIKKGEPPIGYAKIDEEWQYISKIAKGDEKAAMDMWTQYVMARELIADGGLDDEVLQIFKDNRAKNLAGKLTLNQISKYGKGDLPILIARAYLNTKQLYEDGVLREAFRTKLIQLTSGIEMTTEDIDRVKRLIRLQNFASQGETFTDILRNNNIYETAKSLGLDLKGKTGEGLYNGLRDFCKKIATDGIPDGPIVINGIEMQANDVIQIIFSLTGDNNIIKLYRSGKFDDNTVLSIATQYLFGDKKGAENSILSLFQRARQMPKSDDKRGLILKTITGTNITSDKQIGFYDFRAGMYDQDINTRAKADFMNKLADRNKMRLHSDGIEVIQTTESVEELVNILENYRGGYIMVNDAQYNVNPTLRAALNKINYEKGKIVSDDRRVEVIFPRRGMDGNFTVDNKGVVYFRTRDSDWFDELSGTISIQSLGDSNPTREVLASEYELKTGKNGDVIRYQATYNNKVVNNKGTQISDQQDAFFKLSKVRDDNGNLLIVYHGSKEEFDIFDFNRIDKSEYGPGFYFTDDETYALHHGGGIVIETYVNITNPLEYDINAFRSNITQDQMEQVFQRLYNKGIFDDDDFDEFGDRIADAWSTNGDRAFTTFLDIHYAAKNKGQGKDFFDAVRDITGYDGIISHAREGQTFYIAFDQSQIKAIDNLEPALNPSIRYQRMDYSLDDLPEGDYNKIETRNKKVKFARQTGAYDFADDYEFLSNLYSNAQSFKSRINNNELDIIKKYMRVRHIVSDVAEWATKNNIDMKLLNEIDNIIPTGGLYEKNIFDSADFIDYYKGVGNGNKIAKTIDDLLEYGGYDIDVPYGYGSNISSEDSLRGYEWNKKVKESRKNGDYSWADDYDVLKNIYNKAQSFKNRLAGKELDIVKKYMKNRHIISNVSDWAVKNKIDEKLLYEIDDIASLRYSNKIFGDSFVEYYKVVGDGNKLDDTYSAISNLNIRYQRMDGGIINNLRNINVEQAIDEGTILFHSTTNDDLVEFIDLEQVKKNEENRLKRIKELNNRYNDLSGDERQELLNLRTSGTDGADILENIGKNGSRGGEGIYVTSRPYERQGILSDQGLDLGENIYAIYIPKGVKERKQAAGGGYELPEAIIKYNEGIVLGKIPQDGDLIHETNKLIKNYISDTNYQAQPSLFGQKSIYGTIDDVTEEIAADEALKVKLFKSDRTIKDIADQYGLPINVVKSIATPEGLRAYGSYGNGIINISEIAKSSTAPHELFHAIFDLVDKKEKNNIIEQARKLFGDDVDVDEMLANKFSQYFRTGDFDFDTSKKAYKSFKERIVGFFNKIKDWITGVDQYKTQVKSMFDNMINCEYLPNAGKNVNELTALTKYDKEINDLAIKYYGEMLGVTLGKKVDKMYIDRVQSLLSEITGIDIKAFTEIKDKAKLRDMVDSRFTLDKMYGGQYTTEITDIREVADRISKMSNDDLVLEIKDTFGESVDNLEITNENIDAIRESYLDFMTAPTEVDYLTSKGRIISLANGGDAQTLSLDEIRAAFQTNSFEDKYSMFLNGVSDENKKKIIDSINDDVFDTLTISFSENLVKAGYSLPLISCRSLLYDYLRGTLDVNNQFVKAFFTKNDIPVTVDNLNTLLNNSLPKNLKFDYESGLYKGRLNQPNAGEIAVFKKLDNRFLPDSYSALAAIESSQIPSISGGGERKRLKAILDEYVKACKEGLEKNMTFREAQELKQLASYALDALEQDDILPKFGNIFTYQERQGLLGMKYSLPIVIGTQDHAAAITNLEGIVESILDKYDQLLKNAALKNDINISIINNVKGADKKAEKQISERTKQLAEQGATIKEINGEYVVYDVRQAIVDALNPDNMSATIGGLDGLKGIQLRQLETLSNKQAYSLLRYIEAAKALDGQSNLFRTIMYKQSPQLGKVDFFRTFKLDQQSGLPRALLSDRLSQFTIFKDMDNTAPMDITIKKQIFNDIKNTFKKNGYITAEELDGFVVKAVDDNIGMLGTTINPKQIKEFTDTMVKAYNDAFIPYSYLRDLPKGGTLSDGSKLANIHDIVDNFVRGEYNKAIKDVKEFGDNSFDELLNKIYITTVDGDTRLLKDYSNMGIDAWKESIFGKEFQGVEIMSDEDIKKAEIGGKYKGKLDSKRYLRELDEERENIVNQYNSNISAILNDIQIVTQADRDIMGALFPTVRQLMRKYTLTQKIADATDRVSGINEEVARGIKSYLLGFQGQINFSHWGEDDIKKRLKEVQNAYREYYKLSLDRLSTISGPSTPAEGLALNIAKYFKALEDSLGSIDGLTGCTTKAEINRAFYNIGEVFLNIESVPGIYGILSAIEQSQILKYFRYSKPGQASYVKQFDLKRGEKFISERLGQYREFVQDISGISWHEFNDIFGTAFDEGDYKKVIQGLSGLTLSGGSRAILQRLSNILNGSSFLGRLLITYPFQLLTIPQQGIGYFLKMLGQESRLEISSLNEIDAARMKYGKILDGAFNELPSLRYINPDNLSPNAYYNRYGIPDIDDMYRRVDGLQMTDTPEIIEAKTKSILAKTNDGISIFQRWADPYKDNANNIVDGVFARNFKNIAFFKALKENEIMPFGSIKQFSEFMDNPSINPAIKKQLMTRVEELSGRNFRNMLAIGFGGLDRAVGGNRGTNIFYGIMQMFNFRGAWGWNVVKQTNEFITTAFKTILKNPFSKDTQDEFIEYITKQPEWLNFTTAIFNDLVWSWKLARLTDNGDRPDEESEYGIMDLIEYISKSMDMTSQWYQGLQSFGPLRPFQDGIESMRQSLDDPDVYKDKYGVGAFLNSLVSNFGRQWKPRNWIVKMLNAGISGGAENMRAYVENEFWKASGGTLRYMIGEQEGAYGYTYDFSILPGVGIPPIIMGTTYTASDRQFMYDLDSTATWEELKEAFNPDNLNADRITYTGEVLKGMINGSQLVSFLKNAKNLIHDINTRLKGDTDFKNNKYYYTMNDFSQLALKSDAGQEFYRYGYVTPTTTLEARAFFDMVLNHGKYRPGSESFNKSVVQYEETGHMDGSKTGKAADKEMEIWLDDMKYDDNGNINPEWKTFIETVNNNFYDKTATKNYIYETFYNWMGDNSDNPNYNLYLKLLGQGNLNNYIEQRIDEEVKKANIGRGKKADQKWDETEWKNVNYNKLLLEIGESEFKGEGKTVFQEAQLLDKDTATQYALVAIADELQGEDKKELEKFFTVTEDEDGVASIKFNYQYKERLEQFASMARYLEEKNIEGFLAEASSIADPYIDKDPTGIVTAELMDSINNRVQNAEWLSAEEKNEIMIALFHHNREYIEQAPDKLKELLGDDYDRYARAMNEMLHDWDMDTLNNLEQMQMNGEGGGEGGGISKAIKLSSALKSMRLPTSGGSGTTGTSRTRIRSGKFVPTQIKGSELIRDLGLSGYAPKDVKKIALQGYNPSVSFKINKDTKRNKPTRKSTQAISTSKQLSKLEDKAIKAITAES